MKSSTIVSQINSIENIVAKYPKNQSSLIAILQEVQEQKGYLPREDLEFIARTMNISLNKIYGVATFYSQFSLKPKGKHTISVCTGTACHVKGSANLIKHLRDRLNIKCGDTTNDGKFSLFDVRCIGACSVAPAVVIDGRTYGKLTVEELDKILDGIQA